MKLAILMHLRYFADVILSQFTINTTTNNSHKIKTKVMFANLTGSNFSGVKHTSAKTRIKVKFVTLLLNLMF